MLGEITHLQTISEDLKSLTMDPHKLPSSSEQVKGLVKHSGDECWLFSLLDPQRDEIQGHEGAPEALSHCGI